MFYCQENRDKNKDHKIIKRNSRKSWTIIQYMELKIGISQMIGKTFTRGLPCKQKGTPVWPAPEERNCSILMVGRYCL